MLKFRFRYILLLLLLFTGAGLTWGYNIWDANVYFDNTNAQWALPTTRSVLFFPSKSGDNDSEGMNMSHITHTNLLYWHGSWGDAAVDNVRFASVTYNAGGWEKEKKSSWGRLYDNSNCFGMTGTVNVPDGQYDSWLYISASGTYNNTSAVNVSSSNHLTSGYSDLNHAMTVKKATCIDGSAYSEANTVNSGTVTISAYKMTAHGTVSNTSNSATIDEASETSVSVDAAYTGEVTVTATANEGYVFMGWYPAANTGDKISGNASYTFNAPNSDYTLHARFAPKFTEGKRIYLYMVDFTGWEDDDSRFSACFGNATSSSWVDCTTPDDHVCYVEVPEGNWGEVYLCRMERNAVNGWYNWRNRTGDLKAYGTYNCVSITNWNDGSWRKYAPTFAVIGGMNEWDPVAAPMTDNEVTLTLAANQSYAFKVGQGFDTNWYGYGASDYAQTFLGQRSASPALTIDANNMLILTGGSSGSYTFKWNDDDKKLTVEFPDTDKPSNRYVFYENTKKWRNVYAYVYGATDHNIWPGQVLDSISFGGKYYHYVALGDNTSVVFNRGHNDYEDQDDLKDIASNKGKYYQPSTEKWKTFDISVTLDNQSATTAGATSVTATYGADMQSIAGNIPAKTGYTFGGYYAGAGGSGTQYYYADGTSAHVWDQTGSSPTLYAYWLNADYVFTVTESPASDKTIDTENEIIKSSTGGVMKHTSGEQKYLSANPYLQFGNNNSKVTVYLQKYMQAGTIITATLHNASDLRRGLWLCTAAGGDIVEWWSYNEADAIKTYAYIVQADDGLAGTNQFMIRDNGYVEDLVSITVANSGADYTYNVAFYNENRSKIQDGTVTMGASTVTNYAAVQTKTGVQFVGWELDEDHQLLVNPDGSLCANVISDGIQYTDESGKWVYDISPNVYPQWGHTSHISGVRMNGASEENGEFGGWSSTSNTFTIYEGVGTLDIVLSANKEYRIAVHDYEGTSHVIYNDTLSESDGVITLQAGDASDYISFSTGDHEGLCHFTYDFASHHASHQLQINTRLHKVTVGASKGGMDVPYTDPYYNPETAPSVTSGNYYYEGYQFRLKPVNAEEGYYLIGVFEDEDAMGHRWAAESELPIEDLGNKYYAATVPTEDYSLYACYMQTGHIYFIGRDANDPESWDSTANWLCGRLPLITDTATIFTPARVDIDHAVAKSIILDQSGRYDAYSGGTLTIEPDKGLEVTGTIRKRTESMTYTRTSPADLVLESSAAGNATLIFDNSNSCQATVQMFSKGWTTGDQGGGTWNWQLAGVPVTDATRINDYYGGYMYRWAGGEGSGWVDQTDLDEVLTPFAGYIMSYPTTSGNLHTYTIDGTLVPTGDKPISIPANTSSMVITNSWTAPIYVKNITFTKSEPANIYIFNTGYAPYPDAPAEKSGERFAAGTYHAVPVNASPYTGDSLIASMQGFYVRNKAATDGTININYSTVVRPSGNRSINAGQMHAPQRVTDDGDNEDASEEEEEEKVEEPVVLKIYVSDSQHDDRVILLEREDFSRGFDNGWDGEKFQINAVKTAPRLFAINLTGGKEEISAVPDIDGTVIGFRPGTESDYTISFDYNGEESLYLYDNRTAVTTPIDNESIYAFSSVGTNEDARFVIRKIPTVATGTEQLQGDTEPQQVSKQLIDGTLYIERAGRTYNIIGTQVK